MLFARLGMKEHREVAADREIAEGEQLAGIGADDDPVAISDGATEQSITNRTAHEISLHRCVATGRYGSPMNGRFDPLAAGCGVRHLKTRVRTNR